ncbi:MarR family winged helix-turn-helix transcriptional regulator [uncultured Trichococcus sp.]|jgi:DNA-binding MarR family transcriptional regulator|uniref:MarR family winged helix-turn-helix transcriptional regulator n=1 Tax=uncultured Trichococcus sp. TaxID=189665 RepID=UPI002A18DE78|nr:MarR family winged helix-turn-helix transcriptional regulator [uncultured Trichococcus sp.]
MKEKKNLLISLSKLSKIYRAEVKTEMSDSDFSPNELDLITFLSNNEMDTSKEIADSLGLSKSLIARSVDSLVAKSYLETRVDEGDRRYIHLVLTDQAKPIADRLRNRRKQFIASMTEGVSQEQFAQFEQTLEKMIANVERKKEE